MKKHEPAPRPALDRWGAKEPSTAKGRIVFSLSGGRSKTLRQLASAVSRHATASAGAVEYTRRLVHELEDAEDGRDRVSIFPDPDHPRRIRIQHSFYRELFLAEQNGKPPVKLPDWMTIEYPPKSKVFPDNPPGSRYFRSVHWIRMDGERVWIDKLPGVHDVSSEELAAWITDLATFMPPPPSQVWANTMLGPLTATDLILKWTTEPDLSGLVRASREFIKEKQGLSPKKLWLRECIYKTSDGWRWREPVIKMVQAFPAGTADWFRGGCFEPDAIAMGDLMAHANAKYVADRDYSVSQGVDYGDYTMTVKTR